MADGDEPASADLALALAAGACVADASHAFAHFAAGEIALTEDPARGAALLRRAAQEADRVGAEQVGRVARVALLAATTRHGDLEEAAFALEATRVGESGEDIDRYAALAGELEERLGAPATAGIKRLATATPRAQVVRRTEAALRGVTAGRSSSGTPPTMWG